MTRRELEGLARQHLTRALDWRQQAHAHPEDFIADFAARSHARAALSAADRAGRPPRPLDPVIRRAPGVSVFLPTHQARQLARLLRAHYLPEVIVTRHRISGGVQVRWHLTDPQGRIISDSALDEDFPTVGVPIILMSRRLWKVSLTNQVADPYHVRLQAQSGSRRHATLQAVRRLRALGQPTNLQDVVQGVDDPLPY
ncbi:hypothetical protein [Deinococcus ruber]|uniref:Uncharacterized protein n=1 Tax=Deinococcus ruber TaxID=1848197 RepID=A0A918FCZ1_9DEIO|nr:hypothetical protein [Deinococcus ruber]GGR31839.1 hypothetical protein GCM10008957_48090 [Deinococcus ruber]